ncbi:MAG: serine protein kinase [Planctomycetes bacterium]|nr:serine protein kinase [Planctomycetota bacterium]
MSEFTSLFDLAGQGSSQENYQRLRWSGSLAEYMELLGSDGGPARNAWQRLLDMIESHGSTLDADGKRLWNLFEDPMGGGRDGIFGMQKPLADLVDMIRAGARHLGPERRLLLLHGPVGSAKSTIVRLLKAGLENYTKQDQGRIFTFEWIVDGETIPSATRQSPLLLIPAEQRDGVQQRLNESFKGEYELRIEGQLDPLSMHYYDMLAERYDGDWQRIIEHVRVRRFVFHEASRIGIGTFQPKDEKNQDSTELTGDLNYRKIAEYGSDSDPRAFNFDGEFHVANRGLLEFVEVLKLDVAFLYDLLGATQERAIKPKKFQQCSIDEVILGHTNEPEYRRLAGNDLMEAFRDRTIRIDVPYNLTVDGEVQIYRRRYGCVGSAGRELAPHSLRMAALWSVLTRLEEPTHQGLNLLQKARLYNGDRVPGFEPAQAAEVQAQAKREGLFGISPRYVQDRIAICLVQGGDMPGPREVLESIRHGLLHHSLSAGAEDVDRYLHCIDLVESVYDKIIQDEVREVLACDEVAMESLCSRYVDSLRAYTTCEQVPGPDDQAQGPDEDLMRSVEEKMGVGSSRRDDFRHELMSFIGVLQSDGRRFDYRSNERLCKALQAKRFEDEKDSIQLTSCVSSAIDPKATRRIEAVRDRLIRRFAYDESSASRVLREVAGLLKSSDEGESEEAGLAA